MLSRRADKMPTDKIPNDLLVFCPEVPDSILSGFTFLVFCPDNLNIISDFVRLLLSTPPFCGSELQHMIIVWIFTSMTFKISFVLMWTSTGLWGKVLIEGYAGLMVWSRIIFWMHLYCYPVYCCRMSILPLFGGVTRFVVTGLSWEVVVVLEEVGGIGPARPVSLSH